MQRIIVATLMILFAQWAPAHAATCDAGYYLNDTGTCSTCPANHWCANNTINDCPPINMDTTLKHLADMGIDDIISINRAQILIVSNACQQDTNFTAKRGTFTLQHMWNGTEYWEDDNFFYYIAGPGWYLADWRGRNRDDNYYHLYPCTNAPTHAHYTGPGTPDSPDGTVKNVNDCPWECSCGYVRSGNTCVAAGECTAGVKTLRTGTGLVYKLYDMQTTSPTIAIGLNGQICYACLESGAAGGALNLKWADGIFHAINGD